MYRTQGVVDLTAPTMTAEEAADYLGISRTMAYAEAQRYRDSGGTVGLPNLKLGGRVLIITALVIAMVQAPTTASDLSPLTDLTAV